jgi:hypothetical protein
MPYGSLLADTVQSSTTGTPPQFNDGNGTQTGTLCRAWVNFNGTGTVAIRSSFNVSSITDNGTGDYTVNFTNAMPDTNYVANTTSRRSNSSNDPQGICTVYGGTTYSTAVSTSFVRVTTGYTSNGVVIDYDYVGVAIFR